MPTGEATHGCNRGLRWIDRCRQRCPSIHKRGVTSGQSPYTIAVDTICRPRKQGCADCRMEPQGKPPQIECTPCSNIPMPSNDGETAMNDGQQAPDCSRAKFFNVCPSPFPVILLGLVVLLVTYGTAEARTVVCESQGHQTQYCSADTRGGVRLVRQFSKAACSEGHTWGYDRRGIWVSGGCRGKFETMDYRSEPYGYDRYDRSDRDYRRYDEPRRRTPPTVTCESWGDRETFCRVPLRHGQVEMVRQLSKTQCRYGRNWGWNNGGIWVSGGCRAVFAIY